LFFRFSLQARNTKKLLTSFIPLTVTETHTTLYNQLIKVMTEDPLLTDHLQAACIQHLCPVKAMVRKCLDIEEVDQMSKILEMLLHSHPVLADFVCWFGTNVGLRVTNVQSYQASMEMHIRLRAGHGTIFYITDVWLSQYNATRLCFKCGAPASTGSMSCVQHSKLCTTETPLLTRAPLASVVQPLVELADIYFDDLPLSPSLHQLFDDWHQ
jgi:hypothetical protein